MQEQIQNRTDWDAYYRKPFFASRFTRSILRKHLVKIVRTHMKDRRDICIAELGGGASCYMNALFHNFSVRKYHVFDSNAAAMRAISGQVGEDYESSLILHEADLLEPAQTEILKSLNCHLAFSGGLIEHFDGENTAKLIRAHFDAVAPGGLVIFLFPVNSILYRLTRKVAEWLDLWIFHDERPLHPLEVIRSASPSGDLLDGKMIHSVMLSQALLVFRKRA